MDSNHFQSALSFLKSILVTNPGAQYSGWVMGALPNQDQYDASFSPSHMHSREIVAS